MTKEFKLAGKDKLIRGGSGFYSSYICKDEMGELRINLYTSQPEELKETLQVGDYELECISINNKTKIFYKNDDEGTMTIKRPATLEEQTITLDDLENSLYEIYINANKRVDNVNKDS